MNSAFPTRLKAARRKAGLSQEQLADALGITKQAISKYEHGKMLPDSAILIQLSKILGFKADYFFREYRISLEKVDFRKRASLSGKYLDGVKTEILDKLERYFELEELLNLSAPFVNPLAGLQVSGGEDVENAAQKLLQEWGLGLNPIPNVIEMLEDASIKVVEIEADGRFDGLSAMLNESIPIIVLNTSIDLIRKRFTALHELGHLLLNFSGNLSDREKEQLCNRFAGALLLPKQAVESELSKHRNHIALNELIPIKESYGISVQAIMYRAGDLGILPPSALARFWRFRNSDPKHRQETGWGDYKGVERSSRFEKLLFQAVAEEIISYSKAASLAGMSLSAFRNQLTIVA